MESNDLLKSIEEMIENKLVKMDNRLVEMDNKFNGIQAELKEFRKETNDRFDKLENKLDDTEAGNTNRHLEIFGEIKQLRNDFTVIEIVTGKNMTDIANLKAIK